jgi:hypothetical protein
LTQQLLGQSESKNYARGIVDDIAEASPLPRGKKTKSFDSSAKGPEWDLNTWQHSKPALFDSGRGIGCMQLETSVASTTPITRPVSIRVLRIAPMAMVSIGVCSKISGKMGQYWKFNSNGSKFAASWGMNAGPKKYGISFGDGDVVTVQIVDDVLEFIVNGRSCGAAFKLKESDGPFYLRAHLTNSVSIMPAFLVGKPNQSDPNTRRSEVQFC